MEKKIDIKNWKTDDVIFSYTHKFNTIAKTVDEAVKQGVNLSYADLKNADLSYSDLSNIDLSYANLQKSCLSHCDLSNTNLSNADLYGAYLYDKQKSNTYINFIMEMFICRYIFCFS